MTTWIEQRLIDLSACLAAELSKPACWHGIWHGQPQWAACDECSSACGMAYVRLTGSFPSSVFPQPDEGGSPCTAPMAHSVEIGVLRCLPAPDADGSLPPPADFAESFALAFDDHDAMLRAIRCCLADDVRHSIGEYEPVGPEGMCAGGLWTVILARD